MPSAEREQGEAGSGVGRAAEVRGHEPGVQHHVSWRAISSRIELRLPRGCRREVQLLPVSDRDY